MRIKIEKCVFGGEGLAHLDGKAVFVDGALPGEEVEVEITEDKKNYRRARIIRIAEASPHRIEPLCPHSRYCGGCQYQHVSYAEELRLKQEQLQELFARAGFESPLRPIIPSEAEWRYRTSLTLHPVQASSRPTRMGLVGKDGRSIISIQNCLIADPAFAPLYTMEISAKKIPERVTYKLDESGRVADDLKETFLVMRLGKHRYLVPSGGFFQTNPGIALQILERTLDEIRQMKPDALFDLFSGVGTFGLPAAGDCGSVFFVEESPRAVQALRMNIAERKLPNTQVAEGRVEQCFRVAWKSHGSPQAVMVADPPRAGLERSLAEDLARLEARRLIYLSCDPATLARDLRILTAAGKWSVREIQPFDMFPKTQHVEIWAVLSPL